MNSQELRALQEAYIQVYDEDYKPWDFGPKQNAQAKHAELAQRKAAGGSAPGTATRANKIASVGREMRTTLDRDSANTGTNPAKQGLQPSTQRHTAAALRGAGGGTTASTKFDVKPLKPASKGGGSSAQGAGSPSGTGRYTPGGGQGYGISGIKLADSYDLYDIILSHLLDEGYAETVESAEAIMVNMSEDWRESIVEEVLDEKKYEADEKLPGSGKTPNEKMQRAQGKHGANYMSARGDVRFRGNPANSSHSRGRKVKIIKDIIASGEDPRNSSQAGIGWGNDARKIGRPGDRPGDRIKKTNRTEDDDAKSTHTQGGLRAHKTKAGGYRTLKKNEG